MRHPFSGDPWGPCTACTLPAYHAIHRVEQDTPKRFDLWPVTGRFETEPKS